ncbi:unnamed protein product, partial [Iphiclides podalirius]
MGSGLKLVQGWLRLGGLLLLEVTLALALGRAGRGARGAAWGVRRGPRARLARCLATARGRRGAGATARRRRRSHARSRLSPHSTADTGPACAPLLGASRSRIEITSPLRHPSLLTRFQAVRHNDADHDGDRPVAGDLRAGLPDLRRVC